MARHRLFPRDKKEYHRDYYTRYTIPKREKERQLRREDAFLASDHYFNIQEFLSSTFERNYCLQLFFREKGKLIRYLHEKGASEDQIAATVKILEDITKE